jgi:hypothetical protein
MIRITIECDLPSPTSALRPEPREASVTLPVDLSDAEMAALLERVGRAGAMIGFTTEDGEATHQVVGILKRVEKPTRFEATDRGWL